jgi:hypothetical protein
MGDHPRRGNGGDLLAQFFRPPPVVRGSGIHVEVLTPLPVVTYGCTGVSVWTDDFNSGTALTADYTLLGSPTKTAGVGPDGSQAVVHSAGPSESYRRDTTFAGIAGCVSIELYVPSAGTPFFDIIAGDSNNVGAILFSVGRFSAGVIDVIHNNSFDNVTSAGGAFPADTWFTLRIEFRTSTYLGPAAADVDTDGYVRASVNNVLVADASNVEVRAGANLQTTVDRIVISGDDVRTDNLAITNAAVTTLWTDDFNGGAALSADYTGVGGVSKVAGVGVGGTQAVQSSTNLGEFIRAVTPTTRHGSVSFDSKTSRNAVFGYVMEVRRASSWIISIYRDDSGGGNNLEIYASGSFTPLATVAGFWDETNFHTVRVEWTLSTYNAGTFTYNADGSIRVFKDGVLSSSLSAIQVHDNVASGLVAWGNIVLTPQGEMDNLVIYDNAASVTVD